MKVIANEKIPIKMWLQDLDAGAKLQARNLANLPFAFHHIAIMPDAHQGYGMPIGGVLATKDVVVPNAIGVDIGCGMAYSRSSLNNITTKNLINIVKKIKHRIPIGFNHHIKEQEWEGFDRAPSIPIIQLELDSARKQLGTLGGGGGGNHFIEIQHSETGTICVMLHSGSRNFGYKIANIYHNLAKENCQKWFASVPSDLSFFPLYSQLYWDYWDGMTFALKFAKESRNRMMKVIQEIMEEETGCTFYETLDVHHNYAAMEHHFGMNVMLHRKGAIRVRTGELGIIPGSQGTSSYIVEGLGNPESFDSASHGAGRTMSRRKAKKVLSLKEEQNRMEGIIHNINDSSKLDEAPSAYKNIDEVMENQKDLVKIITRLKPLAVVKG